MKNFDNLFLGIRSVKSAARKLYLLPRELFGSPLLSAQRAHIDSELLRFLI